MKIFNKESGLSSKVNFVDNNNVLVGWDDGQCCCENAGYFFSKEIPSKVMESIDVDLEAYSFDTTFQNDVDLEEDFDGGGMETFKLVNTSGDAVYLSIYNHHNGYYSHGFTVSVGGKTIKDGAL